MPPRPRRARPVLGPGRMVQLSRPHGRAMCARSSTAGKTPPSALCATVLARARAVARGVPQFAACPRSGGRPRWIPSSRQPRHPAAASVATPWTPPRQDRSSVAAARGSVGSPSCRGTPNQSRLSAPPSGDMLWLGRCAPAARLAARPSSSFVKMVSASGSMSASPPTTRSTLPMPTTAGGCHGEPFLALGPLDIRRARAVPPGFNPAPRARDCPGRAIRAGIVSMSVRRAWPPREVEPRMTSRNLTQMQQMPDGHGYSRDHLTPRLAGRLTVGSPTSLRTRIGWGMHLSEYARRAWYTCMSI